MEVIVLDNKPSKGFEFAIIFSFYRIVPHDGTPKPIFSTKLHLQFFMVRGMYIMGPKKFGVQLFESNTRM